MIFFIKKLFRFTWILW